MHFDHPHGGGRISGARRVKGGIFRHTLHTEQEVDFAFSLEALRPHLLEDTAGACCREQRGEQVRPLQGGSSCSSKTTKQAKDKKKTQPTAGDVEGRRLATGMTDSLESKTSHTERATVAALT